MKFGIENNIISSYKRLSYDAWYAFAEFIDNSTQAYFDNKVILNKSLEAKYSKLRIEITYKVDEITISDNSMGMNEFDLDKALKVGKPPINPNGRSKYGLGMKTAACWFGNYWTIKTKKLGENYGLEVNIDVDQIASESSDVDIIPKKFEADTNDHYTIITISKLNRKFPSRTIGKIREHLSSIYRYDFKDYGLELLWNNIKLEYKSIENQLYENQEGQISKQNFNFQINGKHVSGWVGVIGRNAGRKLAGFSIIQNRRIIQSNYKPSSVFGQEDGSNDLVNQRLVGELYLDSFSVSHTKDKIVWEMDEEETLDEELKNACEDMRNLALTLRFKAENQKKEIAHFKEESVLTLTSELKSDEITDLMITSNPLPEEVLEQSSKIRSETIQRETEPVITVDIGIEPDIIHVSVFFNENSTFEPYILVETSIERNKVIVIINILHPHVQEMTNSETFTNFVRHSIYDGIAEWRALKLRGKIQSHTIKSLKDELLRVPYEIKTNRVP